uniref:Leucine rich repeat containing 74A n=1 Tax=Buteo japonicus TaxID=224669 RepID=A0A8C0BAR9_9AVES
MEVVPVSHFIQNLAKPYINLNHHGLGPKGVKAIAIALVSNATVTHLELEDNCILAEGAICITEMLRENSSLQELNMSNNHLDTAGAEAFASLLLDNMSYLHTLQLSGGLWLEDLIVSAHLSLQGNYQVKELDLSHNEFSEKGGQLLGQMLGNLINCGNSRKARMVSVTLATMTNVSEHKRRMRNHSNSSPCQRERS